MALDRGEPIPAPGALRDHQRMRGRRGWAWGVVDIDLSRLDDRVERVNITRPRRVLHAIDKHAARAGESHSGFLARAALYEMRRLPG